jgi:cell division protein FtsB
MRWKRRDSEPSRDVPVAETDLDAVAGADLDPDELDSELAAEGAVLGAKNTAREEMPTSISGASRVARLGPAKRQSLPLRLALGGAVVFVVGLLVTAGAKSYRDLQIVRQREAQLAVRITASEERLEDLRHRLELLRDDPATLERLAREELGLVGKDDVVFVLPSEP